MTQEDKAKAYDEAIERAKEIHNEHKAQPFNIMLKVFPELKESEDERIRKDIIAIFKGQIPYTPEEDAKKYIAWLEKQGEQKETACDRCRKAQPNGSCQDITALGRCYIEGERKVKDTTVIYHESGLKALEKSLEKGCTEGEQKPTDKVEPKFKIGDWVVYDHHFSKIKDVDSKDYFVEDTYGDDGVVPIEFMEQHYHLWTIQDAKAGDVLVTDDMIVLLKKRLENDSILTYFHYDTIDDEYEHGAHLYYAHIYPAAKEQRDQLEKAMADARYTFDFEKKELKKIEQDTYHIQLTEFEDAIKDMMNDYRDAIGDDDVTVEEVKKHSAYLQSLIPQNPTWSEEDERMLQDVVNDLRFVKELISEPKYVVTVERVGKEIDWMKSLKDKYTWKPSDEQMELLETLVEDNNQRHFYTTLNSLYEQLKKLREG